MFPWQDISTTSSPVYDFGEKKAVKMASSTNLFFIKTGRIVAFLCFKTDLLLESFAAILVAISPLSRITPIAEKPDGVDWDTIVATDTKPPFYVFGLLGISFCWAIVRTLNRV